MSKSVVKRLTIQSQPLLTDQEIFDTAQRISSRTGNYSLAFARAIEQMVLKRQRQVAQQVDRPRLSDMTPEEFAKAEAEFNASLLPATFPPVF